MNCKNCGAPNPGARCAHCGTVYAVVHDQALARERLLGRQAEFDRMNAEIERQWQAEVELANLLAWPL